MQKFTGAVGQDEDYRFLSDVIYTIEVTPRRPDIHLSGFGRGDALLTGYLSAANK